MTTAQITATMVAQEFPATQAPIVNYHFTITGDNLSAPIELDSPVGNSPIGVTTGGIGPGTYSVSVQAMDANGMAVGTAVSDAFTVAAPGPISLQVPSTVGVVVTP